MATRKESKKIQLDELRDESRFDYEKAKPNRFAGLHDLGTEIAALFSKEGIESQVPELRGHEVKPLRFTLPSLERRTRRCSRSSRDLIPEA